MNVQIDEIVSLEYFTEESFRYDITVANNHNFIANGILVHNCQNVVNEIFGYEPHRYHFDTSKLPEDAIAKLVADGVLVSTGENKYDKIYPAKASRDTEYEVTIKMDGSSMTVYHKDGQVGVCSRNLELKTSEENKDNAFVKMFFDSKLNEILPTMGNYAVQGELCGPGIQGNQESLKENNFFIFNVFNIDTQEYLSPDDRFYFVQELIRRDLNKNIAHHVPVLHDRVTLDGLGISNVQQLLAYADGPSLNAKLREGLVFKSYSYSGSFSFKAISNRWLSKNE